MQNVLYLLRLVSLVGKLRHPREGFPITKIELPLTNKAGKTVAAVTFLRKLRKKTHTNIPSED